MSDLNEEKRIGPSLIVLNEKEYVEQLLINTVKAFDNPLEAIGIVMRETDFSFSPSGKVCEFPERYHAWFMGNLGEATIPADSEGSLTGDNILNTLKEGK